MNAFYVYAFGACQELNPELKTMTGFQRRYNYTDFTQARVLRPLSFSQRSFKTPKPSWNTLVHREQSTTRLNRVMLFINDNLAEKLTLEMLAKEACFSPYHFHRIFTAIIRETPNAYINRVRLERAANMLQSNPGMSITDIAFATGFSPLQRHFQIV